MVRVYAGKDREPLAEIPIESFMQYDNWKSDAYQFDLNKGKNSNRRSYLRIEVVNENSAHQGPGAFGITINIKGD